MSVKEFKQSLAPCIYYFYRTLSGDPSRWLGYIAIRVIGMQKLELSIISCIVWLDTETLHKRSDGPLLRPGSCI